MLTPETIQRYQQESVARAGYCAHCMKLLASNEVYCCEKCASEFESDTDPNYAMRDEDNGKTD